MKQDNPLVITYALCFMLILFLISACKEPYREYFIGKWTSSDYETELYIKSDSSFIAKNFIINTVDDKTKRIDGKGIWRVIKFSKTFRLELIFYEPEIDCNIYFDHRDSMYKKQYDYPYLYLNSFL